MPIRTAAPAFASSSAPVQRSVTGPGAAPAPLAARAGHSLARVPIQASGSAPIQCGKKTAPQVLTALETRGIARRFPGDPFKTRPKRLAGYKHHKHAGRSYWVRFDPQGRVSKVVGNLAYTQAARAATGKVANKRKNDVSAHAIAHSLGAPPDLSENYFALDKAINSAGGDYGKMEHYLRKRMAQNGSNGYMAVNLRYPNDTIRRPHEVVTSARFNRSPSRVIFNINAP
jgi:DNA/RNA non-specific endonuclease